MKKFQNIETDEKNETDENFHKKEYKKYYIKDLYEAQFYKNIPFRVFYNKIKKDGLEIDYLSGNNGKIL